MDVPNTKKNNLLILLMANLIESPKNAAELKQSRKYLELFIQNWKQTRNLYMGLQKPPKTQ